MTNPGELRKFKSGGIHKAELVHGQAALGTSQIGRLVPLTSFGVWITGLIIYPQTHSSYLVLIHDDTGHGSKRLEVLRKLSRIHIPGEAADKHTSKALSLPGSSEFYQMPVLPASQVGIQAGSCQDQRETKTSKFALQCACYLHA